MRKIIAFMLVVSLVIVSMFTMTSCGHQHSYVEEVVAPTCTEKGYTKYTCSCGESYTENETPAAHAMMQVVAKAPTCTEAGEAAYSVCSKCGHVEGGKSVIPATGHLYDTTYIYPTATTAGSRTSVCKVCQDTKTITINALSATMPNVSDVIVELIGAISASVSLSEGSELVYVTELDDYTECKGVKGVLFFEIAEAVVDSTGEELKAHLKLKVGAAESEVTGLVPVKDVVVSKDNADFMELYIYVNGEDVSIEIDDQTQSMKLSELFYSTMAQAMGLGSYEELLEGAYVAQELSKLMPLVEKALESLAAGIPTVSPEYVEHLEAIFALLGEEIVTETPDENGNTTYSINPAALKKLLEDVEGKTLVEYLEGVYGENVVGALSDFLRTMPDKTVKEIVDAAVALAEGTDVALADVYMFIDLYVYFNTSVEFNIENEITDRYNKTLAELLVEFGGIDEAEAADFIKSMKESFASAAEMLETVSVDELLSMMLMGAKEGFFENLAATIDMLGEEITLEVTMDANGAILSVNAVIAGMQFNYEIVDNNAVAKLVMPNGMELTLTANESGFEVVVTQDGKQLAAGSMTVTEKIGDNGEVVDYAVEVELVTSSGIEFNATANGEGISFMLTQNEKQLAAGDMTVTETLQDGKLVKKLAINLQDNENDLLEFEVQWEDGVLMAVGGRICGYRTEITSDPETGKETETTELVELLAVAYVNAGENGDIFMIKNDEIVLGLLVTEEGLAFSVQKDQELLAAVYVSFSNNIFRFAIEDEENVLLEIMVELNETKDMVVRATVELNAYSTKFDPETNVPTEEFVNIFEGSYELIENPEGEDYIRLEYMGVVRILSYEKTETGVMITVTDENGENTFFSYMLDDNGEAVEVDLFAAMFGETMIDVTVTVTDASTDGAFDLTIAIDLDRFLVRSIPGEQNYIEFNGGINFKVA